MTQNTQNAPELIVGLVGPIGCDIDRVQSALVRALKQVDYQAHEISLSGSIAGLLEAKGEASGELITLQQKINAGNKARRFYEKNGLLAAMAIKNIRMKRTELRGNFVSDQEETINIESASEDSSAGVAIAGTCYILRQLKRKEEVDLLQKTYGRHFIQISITQDKSDRIRNLVQRTRRDQPSLANPECEKLARELIETDELEDDDYGQQISKIFHLGDVYINASDEDRCVTSTDRFINALFGRNDISPTKDEFGSYLAKATSLRSADLSRQVGAAIFTREGDVISLGCNEVPKAGGGNYWYEDENRSRDVDQKGEANKEEMNRIIFDFLRVLAKHEMLKSEKTEAEVPADILANTKLKDDILDSMIGDITEYGRMVHAEMNAISDAARLGRSTDGATMYVTTFPCHNCAKHIVASGISRVLFIEPYLKSRAEIFYGDSIRIQADNCGKHVTFSHFEGISPRRYRDIFEKGKRRDKQGEIQEWYQGTCSPRIGPLQIDYGDSELHAILDNLDDEAFEDTPDTS